MCIHHTDSELDLSYLNTYIEEAAVETLKNFKDDSMRWGGALFKTTQVQSRNWIQRAEQKSIASKPVKIGLPNVSVWPGQCRLVSFLYLAYTSMTEDYQCSGRQLRWSTERFRSTSMVLDQAPIQEASY